jgi:hypothetical protein
LGPSVYKEKYLRLEARRKRLVIHGCWSMNIGTVLIDHDYNASPLKGTQTFRAEEKEHRDIKRQKGKEFGLKTNGRKNGRQKLHTVNNMKRIKLV